MPELRALSKKRDIRGRKGRSALIRSEFQQKLIGDLKKIVDTFSPALGPIKKIPGEEDLRGSVIDQLIKLVKGKKIPTADAESIKNAVIRGSKINPGTRLSASAGSTSRVRAGGRATESEQMSIVPSEKHLMASGVLRLTNRGEVPKSNLRIADNVQDIFRRMRILRSEVTGGELNLRTGRQTTRQIVEEGNLKNALKANIRQFRVLNPRIKSSKEAKKDILRRVKRLGRVVTDEAEFDRLLREEGFGER